MVGVDRDTFRSVVILGTEGVTTRIDESDKISFVTESNGEVKTGTVLKIGGKAEKVKFTIVPDGFTHEETWKVTDIVEGTLKVIKE